MQNMTENAYVIHDCNCISNTWFQNQMRMMDSYFRCNLTWISTCKACVQEQMQIMRAKAYAHDASNCDKNCACKFF